MDGIVHAALPVENIIPLRVIIPRMLAKELSHHSMRPSLCMVLITGFFGLQAPSFAEVNPCAGTEGKTRHSPSACSKPDRREKSATSAPVQQTKSALKSTPEEPSEHDEPVERENRQAPVATQAPHRQDDLDTEMFRR